MKFFRFLYCDAALSENRRPYKLRTSSENQEDSSGTGKQQLCHDGDSLISQRNSNGAAFPFPSSTQRMGG